MLHTTHVAAGAITAALVLNTMGAPLVDWPAGLLSGAVASALPDIDMPGSFAGRRLPVGRILSGRTHHRLETHSFLAVVVFAIILRWAWPEAPAEVLWGAAAGYLSHIVIDVLNPEGAAWFWPLWSWKVTLTKHLPGWRLWVTGDVIERKFIRPVLYVGLAAVVTEALR